MNKMKQACAILLAIVLVFGTVLQPGRGSVFAESTEPATKTDLATEPPELTFYEKLMDCETLTEFEALLCAKENKAELKALTQKELKRLLERVEEIYEAIKEPTDEDTLLEEELLEKLNELIIVVCPECGGENGEHKEGCSALGPVCTCGSEDGNIRRNALCILPR